MEGRRVGTFGPPRSIREAYDGVLAIILHHDPDHDHTRTRNRPLRPRVHPLSTASISSQSSSLFLWIKTHVRASAAKMK